MNTLPNIPQQTWKGEMMKQWKIIMSAIVVAVIANTSMAEDVKFKLPKGWDLHSSNESRYESQFNIATGSNSRRFVLRSKASAQDTDYVAITKSVNVFQLQGKQTFLAIFLKGSPNLERKDVWIRYFGPDGVLSSEQVQILEDDDPVLKDNLTPAFLKTRVPFGANRMEIGMGMRGQGVLEIGRLTFGLAQETPETLKSVMRDPLSKEIRKVSTVSDIDPLKISLDD